MCFTQKINIWTICHPVFGSVMEDEQRRDRCKHDKSRFPPKEKAALTEDNMYFVINEIPQGNLSIIVRPKGLHINQPKVEIKFGHGVMGQASSFDDRLSGKAQTRGKTGGTSLTSLKYPDVCPLPASRFGAEAISFFAGRQESERADHPCAMGFVYTLSRFPPKEKAALTEDNMYFVINEIPQGNLSIIVRPKGLHINQPKVEIKFGHGVMGQASSFDDRLSGKAQTRGKTGAQVSLH
jgi:hypothetical protein